MIDIDKIDDLFNEDSRSSHLAEDRPLNNRNKWVRWVKLAFPSAAAVLIALLLIFPSLSDKEKEFYLDITRPKQGELEKLHIEKTVFNITDRNNQVHNFTADNIDETAPGSKLIKLTNPDGIMPSSKGAWFNIKAPIGFYDQNSNKLTLNNNVEVFYNQGMTLNTTEVVFDFAKARTYGNKPVKAQGYIGDLEAQGFEFFHKTGIMSFTGKTHIIINENTLKGNNDE